MRATITVIVVGPSRQIAWFKEHGIRVFVTRLGHPRVLRSDLENEELPFKTEPDLDSLDDVG